MTKPLLFHYQHNNDDPKDDNLYVSTEYAFCVNVDGCNRMIAHLKKTDPEFEGNLQAWLDYSESYQEQTEELEMQYGIHEVCHHTAHDEIFTTGYNGGEIPPRKHVSFINSWRKFFVKMAGKENVSPAMLVDSRVLSYGPPSGAVSPNDSTSLHVYNVLQAKLSAQAV